VYKRQKLGMYKRHKPGMYKRLFVRSILDICRDTAKFQTYAWRYCRSSFMPSDGWYFCDGGDSVKSQRIEHMFSQTAVCLMNVEVGQILPTILVGSFFPNKYGKPQIPIPSQMLSYMNASGEQICFMSMAACLSLIPPISSTWSRIKVPFQKKVKFQLLILDNDALTSLLHCHYLAFLFVLFWGGSKFKYLCLLLLSCGHFATHRMVFGSV